MENTKQLKQYIENVRLMREAQQAYFLSRKGSDESRKLLNEAKRLEKIVDKNTSKALRYCDLVQTPKELKHVIAGAIATEITKQYISDKPKP